MPSEDVSDTAATASSNPITPLTISLGVIALAFLVLGGYYISAVHTKRAVVAFVLAAVAIAATVYAVIAQPVKPSA